MKFNFRKISAIGASLLMAGMSAGFAAAANYPAPFVQDGVAEAAIVHGTGTGVSALDAVEAGNIQTHLNTFVTSTGAKTVTGDKVLLSKTSDNLNLGDAISGPFGTTVDDDDLQMLADGVFTADDSDTFDYEQRILLGSAELAHFRDSDYETLVGLADRTPIVGVNFSSSQFVMNYTLDFLDDAESDVVSSELADLEGSFLPLLGKEFYVSDWDNGSTAGVTGKLTLLDSAVRGLVKYGEVTTLTLDGITYDISIDFLDADSTALRVNSQITSDLAEGQTEKMPDGIYVGITDVRAAEISGPGGIQDGTVEFSLGSGKLELTHASEIVLNGDTVADVRSYLYHAAGGSATAKVDKIAIEWKADDELFITPESEISMPGFGGIKFTMTDFVRPTEDKITIQNDGDDSVELRIPIKDGLATINLLFANTANGNTRNGNFTGIGKGIDERLATSPYSRLTFWDKKNNLNYHSYFVASYNTSDSSESYLLRLKPRQDTGNNRNETDVYNVVTGTYEATDKIAGDQVNIGDVSITIQTIFVNATDKYVNVTAGTNVNFNTVYSAGGLRVYLPVNVGGNYSGATDGQDYSPGAALVEDLFNLHNMYPDYDQVSQGAINLSTWDNGTYINSSGTTVGAGHNPDFYHLTMDGEDKDDNLAAGNAFEVRFNQNSDNDLMVDQVNGSGSPWPGTFSGSGGSLGKEQSTTNVYESYIYDDVAPKLLHYTKPDQDYVEVYYPTGNSETYGEIYLTESGATSVAEGGVVLVKDTEVSSVFSKNLVVVGGSCINSAAASLVGGAFCGSGWTDKTNVGSGQFLVKAYPDSTISSKLAVLVAGYEAADSQAASTYVTTQEFDSSTVDYVGPVLTA